MYPLLSVVKRWMVPLGSCGGAHGIQKNGRWVGGGKKFGLGDDREHGRDVGKIGIDEFLQHVALDLVLGWLGGDVRCLAVGGRRFKDFDEPVSCFTYLPCLVVA